MPAYNVGGIGGLKVRCVVVDRDGTLIRHVPYLRTPDHVELLPTVVDGLQMLKASGCDVFLHTNQSGIGRGYFSQSDAIACNGTMIGQLGLGEQFFHDVCIAPEAPDQTTVYRKPSPKFGREILRDYALQSHEMCYVGDSLVDMLTAQNVGCVGVGVNTGLHDLRAILAEYESLRSTPVFDTFLDAATYVVNRK